MKLLLLIISYFALLYANVSANEKSFSIDYDNDCFLKDGQPYYFISGNIEYYRVPQKYWKDRMQKLAHMGGNAVTTYISWFQHESVKGVYDFTGMNDIPLFLKTAQRLKLDVIIRLGPYIDDEQDMGGIPAWILKDRHIELRKYDSKYIHHLSVWFKTLLLTLLPYIHPNGGPIIMVQIENEYGSYGCDHKYTSWLWRFVKKYLGNDIVYFTTDGPSDGMLQCGSVNGTFATVDFGAVESAKEYFDVQRRFAKRGPLVNSEFYPGWQTMWGQQFASVSTPPILATMRDMHKLNASFSIYVVHGGTSFGFTGGSEQMYNSQFLSVTTSYDYDAPIREDGFLTPKYFAMKQTIEQMTGKKSETKLPPEIKRFAYGSIKMKYYGSIFDVLDTVTNQVRENFQFPLTVEDIDHFYGYTMYETTLPSGKGVINATNAINDRGYFFVNRKTLVGITQRTVVEKPPEQLIELDEEGPTILSILVDNQGRICYTPRMKDYKGIVQNLTFNNEIITNWTARSLEFGKVLHQIQHLRARPLPILENEEGFVAGFFAGHFEVNEVGDTWLDTTDWGKGNLFVEIKHNAFNLGRYWPLAGPQMTLYHPFVYQGRNPIVAFELEKPGNCFDGSCFMQSVLNPINAKPFDDSLWDYSP